MSPIAPVPDLSIPSPRTYYRNHLLFGAPLLLWLCVALVALVQWDQPSMAALLGLLCTGLAALAYLLPLAAYSLWTLVGTLLAHRDTRRALDALGRGRFDAAEALWRKNLERSTIPVAKAAALHNLGVVALGRGDLVRSRELLERARATGWMDTFVMRRVRVAIFQARAMLALAEGDLEAAQQDLEAAREQPATPAQAGHVRLAEAFLASRRDETERALSLCADLDPSGLPPRPAAQARLLHGWLLDQGGADPAPVLADLSAALDPALLPAHAPELRAFATRQGLLAPDPPDDAPGA